MQAVDDGPNDRDAIPIIRWLEDGKSCEARWRSHSGMPPPARVIVIDGKMTADEAYGLVCQGTALLWRGNFQDARRMLVALGTRADRRKRRSRTAAGSSAADSAQTFHLHRQARDDWGYGRGEDLTREQLIREEYRGIRPAPGYPAQPDHTEKRILFDLLSAEEQTGIRLTEHYAMWPAASVSGLYFAHPQARYFAVDRVLRDQLESYAARKGMLVAEVERWLAPNLGYDPTQ